MDSLDAPRKYGNETTRMLWLQRSLEAGFAFAEIV